MGHVKREKRALDGFLHACLDALEVLYNSTSTCPRVDYELAFCRSVQFVVRAAAILIASEQIRPESSAAAHVRCAATALRYAAAGNKEYDFCRSYEDALREVSESSGISLFSCDEDMLPDEQAFRDFARILLHIRSDEVISPLYFQTMPLSWLGSAYQEMLAVRPSQDGALELSRAQRKKRGVYFTPPCLVTYITEGVLSPLVDQVAGVLSGNSSPGQLMQLCVLDPSMGGGDFLSRAVDFISESALLDNSETSRTLRAGVAANCVYGIDIDLISVEISRFCVWAASGYADGISESIASHLICADALSAKFRADLPRLFPEVFDSGERSGFDAVVGNPPYIAAKNGFIRGARTRGQSDAYLLFLESMLNDSFVRPGGYLSMVLPDPLLVRENAADVRRKLVTDWTVVSLLHLSGLFADANVANAVPICRNVKHNSSRFFASRIDRSADKRSFISRPRKTAMELAHTVRQDVISAQERSEFLYLVEQGSFSAILRRIHGDNICLSEYHPPFVPLKSLNIREIYRGEEIGKSAIQGDSGDFPMLMGGQSIRQYEITWEGRRIAASDLRKPRDRYARNKIVIQKSSAHLIAAYDVVTADHPGYVFPQSVYAVELGKPGMNDLYLLCLLNSQVLGEYIHRTVTGYKLLQPQLELEDIRALPIRRIQFITKPEKREFELKRGIRIFEEESLCAGVESAFPRLSNFVMECLTANPEESDVVHDLLVYLGGTMVKLIREGRSEPDPENTQRLQSVRAAIETTVWRLYSSEPAQMELPFTVYDVRSYGTNRSESPNNT